MSSSKTPNSSVTPHTQPREAAPVYRCCDSHWHFIPHKDDKSLIDLPWYRWMADREDTEWRSDTHPVYVQGGGDKRYQVDDKLVSGFYTLKEFRGENERRHWREQQEWCMGRYGCNDRKLCRKEELSWTPWGGKKDGAPPPYEPSSSSSMKGPRDSDEKSTLTKN